MTDQVEVIEVGGQVQIIEVGGDVQLFEVGIQGPRGPAGPSGGQGEAVDVFTYLASAALSGHRAVYVNSSGQLAYADSGTVAHAGQVLGVLIGAAAQGTAGMVRSAGILTEPTWTWSSGVVFLGTSGALTQTPPSAGFLLPIGVAIRPTVLFVRIGEPVLIQ